MGQRAYCRLTARKVAGLREPGRYADGDGLYLLIDPSGAKRWVLRYAFNGKRRDMGLGPARVVSLSDARTKALKAKQQILDGTDPISARKSERAVPRFDDYARALHEKIKCQWKNPKHAAQWLSTLEAYVFPVFGDWKLEQVDAPVIRRALEPIWLTKPETARRVRQRIAQVLDAGAAEGYRDGDNPARQAMAGHARQTKERNHHAAMPYSEIPAFIRAMQATEMQTLSKLAFELLILTATRTSEIIGARWDEVDLDARLWSIPGERMKRGRLHEIPLADRSVEILQEAHSVSGNAPLIFPNRRPDRPYSNMVFLTCMKRMELPFTVHGFRSGFRDWAAEKTDYPRRVCEYALAHGLENEVEAAYQRSTLLEQRRLLMKDWESFCGR